MAKPKRTAYVSRYSKQKKSKLPLFLVLGGAILLAIVAFFAFQKNTPSFEPEVTGGPALKVDKDSVDLGDVKLGTPVQVSFNVQNVGDQPLEFTKKPYVELKEGC